MSVLFSDSSLERRTPRSYVELTTNAGRIAPVSLYRDLGRMHTGKLSFDSAPAILHEATHHWCFLGPLRITLSILHARACTRAAMFADAANGRLSVHPDELSLALDSHLRFIVAMTLLQPITEGLALFCEFDCRGEDLDRLPLPFAIAASLVSRDGDSDLETIQSRFSARLLDLRRQPQIIDRKMNVLLGPLLPRLNPYLSGYLAVKWCWSEAAAFNSELLSPDTFMLFLRNYIFNDFELVNILLGPEYPEHSFATPFATRLKNRLRALSRSEAYRTIPDFLAVSEENDFAFFDKPSPSCTILSFTDQPTVEKAFTHLRTFEEDLHLRCSNPDEQAPYWKFTRMVLTERDIFVLNISELFIGISKSGACSVWQKSRRKTPLIIGAECLETTLFGQEGKGYGMMLVSVSEHTNFAAFVLNDTLVCDTIPLSYTDETKEKLRRLASNLVIKQQTFGLANNSLGLLLQNAFALTFARSVNEAIDQIYARLALPYVESPRLMDVASKLSKIGLAALFPSPRRIFVEFFVRMSLNAGIGEKLLEELLSLCKEDETFFTGIP